MQNFVALNYRKKNHTCAHKHYFYFYRTDFAMKRGHSAGATASLNAVKIACKLVMLCILANFFCESKIIALNKTSICKAKISSWKFTKIKIKIL